MLGSLLQFVLLLALFFPLAGCDPAQKESPALLQVGQRSLALTEFKRLYQQRYPDSDQAQESLRRDRVQGLLRRLIDRELILSQADEHGVEVSSVALQQAEKEARDGYPQGAFERTLQREGQSLDGWCRELQTSLRLEQTLAEVVSAEAVTAKAVEQYYRDHRQDFRHPETLRVRQILVRDVQLGQELLGRVRAGEAFADLAREASLLPEGELGGDLGWIEAGQLPEEVEETVFALAVGRVSELIHSPYGEHLFLVEERRRAGRETLDQARAQIRRQLEAAAREKAFQSWLGHLRATVSVKVNWELLAEIE